MTDPDGRWVPWKDKEPSERTERILLDVVSGTCMEDSVAVITDEDRQFWKRMEVDVKKIHDSGHSVEIPFG